MLEKVTPDARDSISLPTRRRTRRVSLTLQIASTRALVSLQKENEVQKCGVLWQFACIIRGVPRGRRGLQLSSARFPLTRNISCKGKHAFFFFFENNLSFIFFAWRLSRDESRSISSTFTRCEIFFSSGLRAQLQGAKVFDVIREAKVEQEHTDRL